MRKEESEEGS